MRPAGQFSHVNKEEILKFVGAQKVSTNCFANGRYLKVYNAWILGGLSLTRTLQKVPGIATGHKPDSLRDSQSPGIIYMHLYSPRCHVFPQSLMQWRLDKTQSRNARESFWSRVNMATACCLSAIISSYKIWQKILLKIQHNSAFDWNEASATATSC